MTETELLAAADAEAVKIVSRFYSSDPDRPIIEQYAPPIIMEQHAQMLRDAIKGAIFRIAVESHR